MTLKTTILALLLALCSYLSAQVLNTGNPEVQAALQAERLGGIETSPLANFSQQRTPMMDMLMQMVRDDDGRVSHYIGAEVGSAYENDSFVPGKILYGDEELGDIHYRLNAYNNEVEIKSALLGEEEQLALVKNPEVKIVASDAELHFSKYIDEKGNMNEGYLILLLQGEKYTFYKRLRIKFTEPKPAANSMVSATPSRFTNYTEYYFKENGSETIRELPIHKKRTAKLFPSERQTEIQNYIKNNKPDDTVESEMLRLFDFIEK
ncbi:hypothetical protein FGM00_13515 [Aggregatimonas sangjinii]|uniref:Secreted protein n=1 Tax=Aggregatimonas sangjinii TaxID=2583587 RepID=A0A5B7SVA2_9FLAO|nr:hypothetical protein [Aggregatimonas sangjinii]QCX01083.1 hypothetical protein FGM00_13515 [Aggregatimonas sangjinii]